MRTVSWFSCGKMIITATDNGVRDMKQKIDKIVDKVFIRYDKNDLPIWTPISTQPTEESRLFFSEEYLNHKLSQQVTKEQVISELEKQWLLDWSLNDVIGVVERLYGESDE